MFAIYTLNEASTASSASICPERGGILTSFISHGEELLYLDEDTFLDPSKNVRGGNPILFPICGQLPNSTYTWNGTAYTMKNHGVARTSAWKVEAFQAEGPGAYLTISLESSAETLASYPFAFRLVFTFRLEGGKLTIEQSIRHLADDDAALGSKASGVSMSSKMPVHTGFHPYFKVSGKTICHNLTAPTYFDYNDNCEKPLERVYDAADKVEAIVTTANADGSILFWEASGAGADDSATVSDAPAKIRISASPEYRYWMLWSVNGCDFLCVEPWTARNQEILRGEELLMVAPGEELNLWVSMELVKE